MQKSLLIIIPAYNESRRVSRCLNDIDFYISKNSLSKLIRVVVIDDGSLDDTKEVVNNWIKKECTNKECFSVISYLPNRGKGYAVREGFLKVDSDYVLYTDADGAAPIQEAERLINAIDKGADMAIGSRVLKDETSKVKMGFKRRLVGRIFHTILKACSLADVYDTQCGFKLFKTHVAKKLAENQQCFGFSFDIEYLYLAKKFGYKIKEVPINWTHVEGSKVSLLRDSIKMLVEVLKIRFIYRYNSP